ncbi:MAG: deoxyribonuclease IV [Bacilli bacterium]|nr:deoxyribonuclease IV [Bacilli bacterium]
MIIGSHVSYTNKEGLVASLNEALGYGANTFMIYTGAPQNTKRGNIDSDLVSKAHTLMKKNNVDIDNVIVHAPYIVNLANDSDLSKYEFSIRFLKEEIKRCEKLGINKMVLHPGNHVGLSFDKAISNIVNGLNGILDSSSGVCICLETMAGKGTEIGKTFEEIKQIIDGVKFGQRIMVCLDTCHLNDAGYDLSNFDNVLAEFDKIIGLDKIGCIHINDSKNPINSHKDRHENIGYGTIGFDNLISIIYNEKLKEVPKILETPYYDGLPPYKFEIEMIINKKFNNLLYDDIKKYYIK